MTPEHLEDNDAPRQPNSPARCTTNGQSVEQVLADQAANPTGQHAGYVVLCADERAKGFVRPYRDAYRHVGVRPTHPTRPLTAEEQARYNDGNNEPFVVFEMFPERPADKAVLSWSSGKFWTEKELASGCGTVTHMGRALSETYARQPDFYGATFCCGCNRHLPVEEFVWTADNQRVGS